MGRLARHDPSASTSGNAMRSLWGAHYRTSVVCFLRVDRSHGARCGKRTGYLRQGRRPIRGSNKERKGANQSENVPPDGDSIEHTTTIYGATEWGAHRRGQLARYWRPAISEGGEAMNQGENIQHVHGTAGEEAEASCTYCGRALDDSEGGQGTITCGYLSPAPTQGLCTSSAYLNERVTSREGT